jgi:hypothetical protein
MISSEVQRTLVKSPPELWAELSDPAALARHLGEFGEIRITRVDPEQRVEWEAGDTSGSVVIKPSGWGTKVKLTVTRELAEGGSSAAGEDDGAPETPAQPEAGAPSEAAAEAEADRAIELEATGETPAEDESEPAHEPAGHPGALSAPATHAGSALGGAPPAWLKTAIDLEPEIEPVFEGAPAAETEPAPEADFASEAELEPRRGFFARLFGRLRGPALEPSLEQTDIVDEPATVGTSAGEHSSHDTMAVWAPLMEPEPAVELQASPDHDAAPALQDGPVAEPEPEPEVLGEAEPPAIGERPIGEEIDEPAEGQGEEPAQGEARADISAEIRAAEEVAAEQVTAVLTGVLDRLGAAHHRPFSRA